MGLSTQRRTFDPVVVEPPSAFDAGASWAAQALIELTDTIGSGADRTTICGVLVDRFADLVGPADVGILLHDEQGCLELARASAERLRVLQTFEVEHGQGPGADAVAGADALVNLGSEHWDDRWPRLGPLARALGYVTLHAFPLRLRDDTLGVVEVYDAEGRTLSPATLALGHAMAQGAAIGISHERAVCQYALLSEQLQLALRSRVLIEQAKGVAAARLGVGMDEAFALLRRFARNHNRAIGAVARAVVDGQLGTDALRRGRPRPSGAGRTSTSGRAWPH